MLSLKPVAGPTPAACADLARVVAACPAFFMLTHGKLPDVDAVVAEFFHDVSLPVAWPVRRYLYLIVENLAVVGLIDVLRGWKSPSQSMIGLFLLRETCQNRQLGAQAHALLSEAIRDWPEARSLRIAVNIDNDKALRFWQRIGYRTTGTRAQIDGALTEVEVFDMPLYQDSR